MNSDTGEIRALMEAASRKEVEQLHSEGFEPLPEDRPDLNRAARRLLAKGQRVNLHGQSGLAKLARQRRMAVSR